MMGLAAPRGPERAFPAVFQGKTRRLSGITRYQSGHHLSDPSHPGISTVAEVLRS